MSKANLRKALKRYLPQPVKSWLLAIKYRGAKLQEVESYVRLFRGLRGVEIGGPSTIFSTELPVYQVLAGLDGVNFATTTLWEGEIRHGQDYRFHSWKKGRQLVMEASDLRTIPSASYDFLLSSNCLEHVANPVKAIREWMRIVRPSGLMLLVLPNKESNFDHRRPVTTLEHLVEDLENDVGEDDRTHLDEILMLHDLARDPAAGDMESFRARSLDNFHNRTLHHHVFDQKLLKSLCAYVGLESLVQHTTATDLILLARKTN